MTQRYGRLASRLGIDTHFHSLRHYSATELIAAGVDVRTVAGRLGHSGGGVTTLRVYAAWLAEADQRASASLAARTHARPEPEDAETRIVRQPQSPREQLAVDLRQKILNGEYRAGDRFPAIKALAAEHQLATSTVHRAFELLREWGLIVSGQGGRAYVALHSLAEAEATPLATPADAPCVCHGPVGRTTLREIGGAVVRRYRSGQPKGTAAAPHQRLTPTKR